VFRLGLLLKLQTLKAYTWGEAEWSVLLSGHIIPSVSAPRTHWIWGWVGPGDGLEK